LHTGLEVCNDLPFIISPFVFYLAGINGVDTH
jgi:hypothetical protein